jgi:hypothetical protein
MTTVLVSPGRPSAFAMMLIELFELALLEPIERAFRLNIPRTRSNKDPDDLVETPVCPFETSSDVTLGL